jgi:hypothetical protein
VIASGGKPPLAIVFVAVGLLVVVGREGPFAPGLYVLAAAGAVVCVVGSSLALSSVSASVTIFNFS